MQIQRVFLPRRVRRELGRRELTEIERTFREKFSYSVTEGRYRMSEAATVTFLGDLLNKELKQHAIQTIEGLHSITAEEGGRGAAMETLSQLEGLGITEGFGGSVKEKFR